MCNIIVYYVRQHPRTVDNLSLLTGDCLCVMYVYYTYVYVIIMSQ